jgi:small multidrug resistance family-3 protein
VKITVSVFLFVLAGVCEIGGGYLMWLWLREGKSAWTAILGAIVLVLFGVILTLPIGNFGRVYAAYGGVFVALSVLWGWWVDSKQPDRFDVIGAALCLIGVAVMYFAPRS